MDFGVFSAVDGGGGVLLAAGGAGGGANPESVLEMEVSGDFDRL